MDKAIKIFEMGGKVYVKFLIDEIRDSINKTEENINSDTDLTDMTYDIENILNAWSEIYKLDEIKIHEASADEKGEIEISLPDNQKVVICPIDDTMYIQYNTENNISKTEPTTIEKVIKEHGIDRIKIVGSKRKIEKGDVFIPVAIDGKEVYVIVDNIPPDCLK